MKETPHSYVVFKQVRSISGDLVGLQAVENVTARDMEHVKRLTTVPAPIIQPIEQAWADIRARRFGQPVQWCK